MSDVRCYSRTFLKEFIELYKSEECLWKVKIKDYHNREKKALAYCKLVEKLQAVDPQASRDTVVKKINNLRSSFRKEVKKQLVALKSGNDAYEPQLWYFNNLSFILDQETSNESANNSDEFEDDAAETGEIYDDVQDSPEPDEEESSRATSEQSDHYPVIHNFSREILAEFIELYRSEECLWKYKSKDYHDRKKKILAYDKLIQKLREVDSEATLDTVTKKINNLRSSFRKELKKQRKSLKYGSEIYVPRLWYFDLLHFLVDQEMPNESSTLNEDDTEDNNTLEDNYILKCEILEANEEEPPEEIDEPSPTTCVPSPTTCVKAVYSPTFYNVSKDFLTEFLELYRSEECLWKVKHKDYYNRERKGLAYDKLAQKLQTIDPGAGRETVVKKINNIRTSFRKELRKQAESLQSGSAIYQPRLWYFPMLQFLVEQENHETSATDYEEFEEHHEKLEFEIPEVIQESPELSEEQSSPPPSSPAPLVYSPSKKENHRNSRKKRKLKSTNELLGMLVKRLKSSTTTEDSVSDVNRKREPEIEDDPLSLTSALSAHSQGTSRNTISAGKPPQADAIDTLLGLLLERLQSTSKTREDAYDIFGKNIAAKLRVVSNYQRIFAERLINEVLFEAELGSLSRKCKLTGQNHTDLASIIKLE